MRAVLSGLVVVTVFGAFAAASVGGEQEVPQIVRFEGRLGDVVFTHEQHADSVGDCHLCHHTGEIQKCGECHGVIADAPKKTDSFHMQCKGCHKQEGLDVGCKTCHTR